MAKLIPLKLDLSRQIASHVLETEKSMEIDNSKEAEEILSDVSRQVKRTLEDLAIVSSLGANNSKSQELLSNIHVDALKQLRAHSKTIHRSLPDHSSEEGDAKSVCVQSRPARVQVARLTLIGSSDCQEVSDIFRVLTEAVDAFRSGQGIKRIYAANIKMRLYSIEFLMELGETLPKEQKKFFCRHLFRSTATALLQFGDTLIPRTDDSPNVDDAAWGT